MAGWKMMRPRGKVPMIHPDPQLTRWTAYAAASAVSTVMFLAFGMSGLRWVNRAATRVGVISLLGTVLCTVAGLSAAMQKQSATVYEQPEAIEWCKRVSCSLENPVSASSRQPEQHPGRHKSAGALAQGRTH